MVSSYGLTLVAISYDYCRVLDWVLSSSAEQWARSGLTCNFGSGYLGTALDPVLGGTTK